ncbi:hypothetical protein [Roseivirga thermotolerans]|uniref:Lipocalin-like domain-containing protein n=1 Tax=Roseivirga thermotolerans TaxID=1758176 RepID=A0ABQ3IDL8_9BACT|nr:hypothetical protein [Roseivirga thermotolerans]GHE75934.1 hypothetical protein GCM10011340_35980 [Roseivirga thermotolerans]
MKKVILFILSVNVFTVACKNDSFDRKILGSWSGCFSESQYSEIHFYDDVFFNFFPEDESPQIRRYSIKDDSLFMYEYLESDERKFIYKMEFKGSDILVFSDSSTLIHLQRLPMPDQIEKDISKKPDLLNVYLGQLSRRAAKFDCRN